MDIKINNRLVIINGPSCSGKTTLANRIQDEYNGNGKCAVIGHDDILAYVDKNQSQEQIDKDFHNYYLGTICNALSMPEIELLILDTLNIEIKRLIAFISVIRGVAPYTDPITLIKMNVEGNIHDEFISMRTTDPELVAGIKSQVGIYRGIEGSLNKSIPYCQTSVIKDPRDINIIFDLPKKGTIKKL